MTVKEFEEMYSRFKCDRCKMIIREDCLSVDHDCPDCKGAVEILCEADHLCHCPDEIRGGLYYCPICGAATCPCGSHDVIQLSRITGYYAEIGGWNRGKIRELNDRRRYDPLV